MSRTEIPVWQSESENLREDRSKREIVAVIMAEYLSVLWKSRTVRYLRFMQEETTRTDCERTQMYEVRQTSPL